MSLKLLFVHFNGPISSLLNVLEAHLILKYCGYKINSDNKTVIQYYEGSSIEFNINTEIEVIIELSGKCTLSAYFNSPNRQRIICAATVLDNIVKEVNKFNNNQKQQQ